MLSLLRRHTPASEATQHLSCVTYGGPRGQHSWRKALRSSLSTLTLSRMGAVPSNPTYKDALTYLNSLQTSHEAIEERRQQPVKNLQVSEALDETLQCVRDAGYQPRDFDSLNAIHVAGTKGKGTTCAFVNSILLQYQAQHGVPRRVGLYTSPHLLSVCERIRINSKPISEEKFTKYFFELWEALNAGARRRGADPRYRPPYFRYLTLLSLHSFLREKVDVAVYEVGVGGQFDSTNVFVRPVATGITSLGIDHVQALGATLPEIAWHKAGIMKTGSPAYTVSQPAEAMRVLEARAQERAATLREVPIGKALSNIGVEPDEDFQKGNASLAVVLAAQALARVKAPEEPNRNLQQMLKDTDAPRTLRLDSPLPELFKTGLKSNVWRGRGETVERRYGKWMLDGAHTTASLRIVSDWYGRTIKKARERGEDPLCILVFNQQASSRDAKQLLEAVHHPLASEWHVNPHEVIFCSNVTYKTQEYKLDFVDGNSDAEVVRSLVVQHQNAKWWKEFEPTSSPYVLPSIEAAVELARNMCKSSKRRPAYILCTGTFRIVGGALTILEGEGIATEASTSTPLSPKL